jgi:hypothetical protein
MRSDNGQSIVGVLSRTALMDRYHKEIREHLTA